MRVPLAGLVTLAGFLVLIHTTYAVIKYRDLLRLTQEEFKSLPLILLLELTAGTAIAFLGALGLAGTLKPVITSRMGGLTDAGSLRLDFISFNHRGKAFHFDIPSAKP